MDYKNLGQQLIIEIEEEKIKSLSNDEVKLHSITQMLLKLERDLNVPGAKKSDAERVERLLEAIAKENF
jgi:hypothetical protein